MKSSRTSPWLMACAMALFASSLQAGIWPQPQPAQPEFLPVDQAFEPQPAEQHGDRLRLAWRIAPAHYLYRHGFELSSATGAAVFGTPEFTPGIEYHDEHFGEVRIYRDEMVVWVPLNGTTPKTVSVRYQGCAEAGLCYPPQTRTLEVERL